MSGGLWQRWRRRALVLTGLMVLSAAAPATARGGCVGQAIESCDQDFGSWYYKLLGLTYWCYIVRVGWCELAESLQ